MGFAAGASVCSMVVKLLATIFARSLDYQLAKIS